MKLIPSLTRLALVAGLCLAILSESSAAGIQLKMSATQPPDNPNCLAVNLIKSLLEKNAPGKFDVQVICGGALGSDVEVARQVRAGLLQFATNSSANLSNILPTFAILDLPFMFSSADQAKTVLSGPFADELLARLPEKGIKGLSVIPAGFRQVFNSKRAVNTMADLKGLKLRSTRSPIDIAATKSIGIAPTPLGFAEVYSAIQTDVVEGVLVPSVLGYSMRFHEVAPFHAVVNLQLFALIWFVNNDWWENLPDDLKPILLEAVKEARQFELDELDRQRVDVLTKMKDEGATITFVSEEAKMPMMEAARPVWDANKGADMIPPEIFDKIAAAKMAAGK